MLAKVILVDTNPKVVEAWQYAFEDYPEVEIAHGSMLTQNATAWVTGTTARGFMNDGLDKIIKNFLGVKMESSLRQEISNLHDGYLPIGNATCLPTGTDWPRYLISTPISVEAAGEVNDTLAVALACAAAFQAVHAQNARDQGSIRSVAIPGLGANRDKVSVKTRAEVMRCGYELFRRRAFPNFESMRTAVEEMLIGQGLVSSAEPLP